MIPAKWTLDNRPLVWTVENNLYNLYIRGILTYAGLTLDAFFPLYMEASNKIER
jgi:hypothetical protein